MGGNKLKIAVLMGGQSAEHEISLKTGGSVLSNLSRAKYNAFSLKITKSGKWMNGKRVVDPKEFLKKIDLVFNALHGEFGEDGRVQSLLEFYKVPYTGSGVLASALSMDKTKSRDLFKQAGLNVPRSILVKRGEENDTVLNFFISKVTSLPVVIKPNSRGSSVGVSIVSDPTHIQDAIKIAFGFDDEVVVEEYIDGIELTSSLIENYKRQRHFVLPATQIMPAETYGFFSYDAKYLPGATRELTPAPVSTAIAEEMKDITIKAHVALGCGNYSRTDVILRESELYVLELNSLPGMTGTSLLPQQAQAVGITFPKLLDVIIRNSL